MSSVFHDCAYRYVTLKLSRLVTKQTKWLCAQQRLRSAWASAQSDQSLRCPHEESLGPYLPIERTAKTLIRLGGCPGWSESSLGAHPLCWFCHEAAQFYVTIRKIIFLSIGDALRNVDEDKSQNYKDNWQWSALFRRVRPNTFSLMNIEGSFKLKKSTLIHQEFNTNILKLTLTGSAEVKRL